MVPLGKYNWEEIKSQIELGKYTLKEIAEIENLAYNSVAARRRKLINRIRNLSPDEKEQDSRS